MLISSTLINKLYMCHSDCFEVIKIIASLLDKFIQNINIEIDIYVLLKVIFNVAGFNNNGLKMSALK